MNIIHNAIFKRFLAYFMRFLLFMGVVLGGWSFLFFTEKLSQNMRKQKIESRKFDNQQESEEVEA